MSNIYLSNLQEELLQSNDAKLIAEAYLIFYYNLSNFSKSYKDNYIKKLLKAKINELN